MGFGVNTNRIYVLLASATAVLTLVITAGPAAQEAGAASPCVRWGKVKPADLTRAQARKAVLCLLNRERTKRGLGELDRDHRLERAAQKHSRYMRTHGCFDHECAGEKTVIDRLGQVGYLLGGLLRWAYGENIAWGEQRLGAPKAMVKAWMNSSGHRANILNGSFRDIGIGFVEGSPFDKRAEGGIYTTDFGLAVG